MEIRYMFNVREIAKYQLKRLRELRLGDKIKVKPSFTNKIVLEGTIISISEKDPLFFITVLVDMSFDFLLD